MPGAENENYASEIGRESSLAPKAASHRDKALSCVSCPHRRGGGRDRTPLRKPDRVLARVFATTFSRSRAEPRWKAQNWKTQKYRRQPIAGQPAYPGNDRSLGKRVNEVLINNKEVFANLADAEGPVRTRIEIDAFFLFRAQFWVRCCQAADCSPLGKAISSLSSYTSVVDIIVLNILSNANVLNRGSPVVTSVRSISARYACLFKANRTLSGVMPVAAPI